MFNQMILFVSLISLSLQIDHCVRTYEICAKCNTKYFVVQNEYQYICSSVKDCLYTDGDSCIECSADVLPDNDNNCHIISNCRIYDENDRTICTQCIDGYALSSNHKLCVKYDNCRELDSENNCKLCAKHYKFDSNGKCVRSLCEKEEGGICKSCSEGYYLDLGECIKIPIDYCSKYEEESCTECFHYARLEAGYCILENLISGCNRVDDKNDSICLHCSMGYQLSQNKEKCELTNCATIEEVCYQCEPGYFIADNGERCLYEVHVEDWENNSPNYFLINNILYLLLSIIFLWTLFNSLKNTTIIKKGSILSKFI